MIEYEDRWIDYEDEETEVAVELADLVFDVLVGETLEDILIIKERRRVDKTLLEQHEELHTRSFYI